jgi:hypothetical protein
MGFWQACRSASTRCSALVMLGFSAIVRFQSAACSRRDSSQSLPSGHPAFISCLLYVLRVVPSNNALSLDRSFGRFGRLLRPGVIADRSELPVGLGLLCHDLRAARKGPALRPSVSLTARWQSRPSSAFVSPAWV